MDPRQATPPSGRRDSRSPSSEEKALARDVSLRRIGALFRPHRRSLAVVVVAISASAAVGMASPFLLREVIDVALPHRDVVLLAWLAAGMVAVAAVTAALGVAQTWISTRIGQEVMHGLRTSVFAHLQRQSLAFFTRTRTGEVQSRITNDIGGMQSVVTTTATSIASNVTTTVATLVAMLALSWPLTLVSLVVMPPAVLLTRRVARTRRAITTEQQRELADLNVTVEESLSVSGAALSKTLGSGPELVRRFDASSHRLVGLELRAQLAGRWTMAVTQVVFAAVPAVIYLSAGMPFVSLSIGTLVAFTALQAGLFRPMMSLLSLGVQIVSSLALFARIFEYLDLPVDVAEPEHPVAIDPARVRGRVRLEDVTFAYPGADTAALAGVDLDVAPGTTLAVVGETGSGKSTLAGLVARLQDPTAGRVTIDGVDVRDIAAADLTRIVGVVSQETYLLHATVRENLRHANPDATDEQIVDAARAAQIHASIESLPDGYDTMVGSRGHRFSGGEKQRIAIARTLLRDPRVLVLDEATSALDTETERAVQTAFDELAVGRTTVTIAHRLSTVRHADRIVVLDHGRITESGTHDALVAADGRYAALTAA